ncbi:MAG TPA: TIGR02996 domain-containing protein [Gemmataceae bacterium]|nr:TIGR02996 domain-containing protein [Gemmataceae bacterium]
MLDTATDTAFLRSILASPDDDAPRLVYADWLDENGDSNRAEFIRLQIRLARSLAGDPDLAELKARADDLGRTHHVEWLNRLPDRPGVHWEIFHRGFISAVRFDTPDAFFGSARNVFRAAPIEEVRLHHFYWPDASRLAESRHLDRVRILDLNDGNRIGNKGVEALMLSPQLANLRELKLGRNSLGSAAARAIADSRHVRGLRLLKLERNDMFDDALRFLAESAKLSGLEVLDMERTRTGDDGVKALAKSKHLTHLQLLDLSHNQITDAGVSALAESKVVGEMRVLFLHTNHISDDGVEALARSESFARLERIFLRQNKITDVGATALARSPYLEHLRELHIGENRISDFAGDELRARFGSRVNLY